MEESQVPWDRIKCREKNLAERETGVINRNVEDGEGGKARIGKKMSVQ